MSETKLGFWTMAEKKPEHTAVVDPDGAVISFGALARASNRVAHGLRKRGIRRGEAVALLARNEIATLTVTLGAMQSGFYVTPVNWHLTAHEVAYIVGDCEAKAFFASERFAETALRAADSLGFPEDARFGFGNVPGFRPFAALTEGQPDTLPDSREAGEIMTYTAGTTGKPKGVKRSLKGQDPDESGAAQGMFLMLFDMKPEDGNVHLVAAPLYHTAVMRFCLSSLHFGHSVVLMDKWTPEECLERIHTHRVTQSHMVPTMFHRMLQLPEAQRRTYDVSSLRYVIHSAAPCPVPIKHQMLDWWGPVIYEYYAATEGGGPAGHTAGLAEEARHRGEAVADLRGQDLRRRRQRTAAQRDRNGVHEHDGHPVRVSRRQGQDGQGVARRFLYGGGRGLPGRGRVPVPVRPQVGHDHQRRREYLPGRDRV